MHCVIHIRSYMGGAISLYPLWEMVNNTSYSVYSLEEVPTPDENVKMTKMRVHSDEQFCANIVTWLAQRRAKLGFCNHTQGCGH